MVIQRVVFLGLTLLLAGCAGAEVRTGSGGSAIPAEALLANPALYGQVLALDPENISAEDVAAVLSKCPAPLLLAFNGSAFDTMSPFSKFLKGMGYPQVEVRNSYGNSKKTAQEALDSYTKTGLRPMLIGHSQGGAFVVKVLHELKTPSIGYAAAVATGKWLRVVLGQWNMVPLLRTVPDSVEEFTGYRLTGDWIGSDAPFVSEAGEYAASGTAKVRNVRLGHAGHLDITNIERFASDPASRQLLETYSPSAQPPEDAKLFFAADIWYHVKKHWCLELQTLIRTRQNDVSRKKIL